LKGVVERNGRRLQARCSWTAAGAALEVGDNMLTLTSAQTEFNLSIRMNL
jgi:hypothetical protein